MNFDWIKSFLPKGLYGRAALILIFPIIAIQLVVSVVFIQRHFDGVTDQLTANIVVELNLLLQEFNSADSVTKGERAARKIGDPLGLTFMRLPPDARHGGDLMKFSDLTGKSVISAIRSRLPAVTFIDLATEDRHVVLHVATDRGPYLIAFNRSRVSAPNPHQLLVLMIVVSILMTLISFIFLRNQVRPIRRLARASEAFGKGQNVRYVIAGATEVRQAGQSFLDMRARIERQIEQRTLMLSGVSHDLRTPLTRLKLGLSMASGEDDIRDLVRDVDDMEAMLDEFLAFARGDSTETSCPTDPVALGRQIADAFTRSGGKIEFLAPEGLHNPVEVEMRPLAVRRALENLITNALRYGSICKLTVTILDDHVTFSVEDNGPGIQPDYRDQAVRPFERLDTARNQNRGTGVGLGLAITTDIASSHGGSLTLGDSVDLGGLNVDFTIPR